MVAIRIRHSIRSVPYGHVVTRDELALMAYGHSGQGALIQVNKFLKELPTSERSTPWHRVLGKTAGKLTLQDGREKKQETLLLKEHPSGVPKQQNRDPKELPQFLAEVFEIVEIAPSKHTHTMIYLHGRKYTGRYYEVNKDFFKAPSCPGLRVVLPTAPADHQLVTQWFDEPTKESLKIGRERVEQIIEDEVARLGDPTRIFLGGSSQGCILGLDCYMRSPYELGGFCGIVGYWPLCSTPVLQDVKMSKATRPVHLLNGTEDKIVDLQEARDSYKVLRKSGLKSIHTEEWPEGHSMGPKEGRWIRAFLKTVS